MSAYYNFDDAYENTSFIKNFQYTDNDGVAIDLSSYGARLIVKRNYADDVAELDVSDTDYITLDASGNINISVPDTEMIFAPGNYIYILYLVAPVTGYEVFLSGQFLLKEGLL